MGAENGFPVKRITVLKIPIDIVPEDKIDEAVARLFADGRNHQIILASLWDLMKARRVAELRAMFNNAGLVVPISLAIVKGAKFLKRDAPVRYMPFDFIIKLLGALERSGKTVYLLGSGKKNLQSAERNIRVTFPGLRVVGRHAGFYSKGKESDIIKAVQKATPSLLMVGRGVPGKERWIPRNQKSFASGLYLWCDDVFDIFAEKRHRVSRSVFNKGLEWLPYTLGRPWKLGRLFVFLWFKILLLAYRLDRR